MWEWPAHGLFKTQIAISYIQEQSHDWFAISKSIDLLYKWSYSIRSIIKSKDLPYVGRKFPSGGNNFSFDSDYPQGEIEVKNEKISTIDQKEKYFF